MQFTHINDSFTSIHFVDSLNGWATSRYVHQTTDGGLNWIQRMDILAFFSQDVHFNDSFGFVIDNLTLYKSSDNGETFLFYLKKKNKKKKKFLLGLRGRRFCFFFFFFFKKKGGGWWGGG
ncbi:MAG: hypothetical protein M5U17_16545 [Ignavibacterium sp.]|nr:hypothetical protein [Ignavibacterium sp.]